MIAMQSDLLVALGAVLFGLAVGLGVAWLMPLWDRFASRHVADLVPTSSHLPLPWIMGYDVEPLVTLETKRRILAQAAAEEWLMVFEHDATTAWGRVAHDGKAYGLVREGAEARASVGVGASGRS